MNTCETCRYYMASPLQEPCESCHWDDVIGHDPSNWEGPTNADRIRAMTDEELAEWLAYSSMPKEVRNGMNNGAFETQADAFLWWLKQEAKE